MHSPLRSQFVSLVLLATLPFAAGCGPEVSSQEEALAGGSSALGAVAESHVDAGTGPTGADNVAVCHIPPGNPANAHTIVVGAPAVAAHLRHGDRLGGCETPDAGGGDDGSGGEPDGGDDSCRQSGESCGEGSGACCFGLVCADTGLCVPQIN